MNFESINKKHFLIEGFLLYTILILLSIAILLVRINNIILFSIYT